MHRLSLARKWMAAIFFVLLSAAIYNVFKMHSNKKKAILKAVKILTGGDTLSFYIMVAHAMLFVLVSLF